MEGNGGIVMHKNNEKFEIFHQNVWSIQKHFLYLPRQKVTIGYPGKFPERASRIRHYPFINAKNPVGYAAESGEQDFIDTTPFSLLKVLFDYPGRIPRGQDFIDTTQKR